MSAGQSQARETAVVATARDALEAGIWVDSLRQAGIEAAMYEQGPGAALGGASVPWASYRVIVAAADLGQARSIIADVAGDASVLEPYRDRNSARTAGHGRLLQVAVAAVAVAVGLALALRLLA